MTRRCDAGAAWGPETRCPNEATQFTAEEVIPGVPFAFCAEHRQEDDNDAADE